MSTPTIKISAAELTRPADTAAYAAGDAVADSTSAPTILTFPAALRTPKAGIIVGARMQKSGSVVTNATFRLHLFNVAVTPSNDNAALALAFADRAKYLGHISFTLITAGSGMAFATGTADDDQHGHGVPLPFSCVAPDNNLYGLLEATGAYTPASGEQFRITLLTQEAD